MSKVDLGGRIDPGHKAGEVPVHGQGRESGGRGAEPTVGIFDVHSVSKCSSTKSLRPHAVWQMRRVICEW